MNLEIRYAKDIDLNFIDFLQKKNAEDLSFYPKVVFEREIKNQRILLAKVNRQHAGYLYHGSIKSYAPIKIHQACIEYDIRGNWYGAGLVGFLEEIGMLSFAQGISLRCGSDISANIFWKLMGFKCIDIQKGGVRRMRDINVWYKQITADMFGETVDDKIVLEPSAKKKDSSFWRKRGKNKSQSSMARGKNLLKYRQEIVDEIKERK